MEGPQASETEQVVSQISLRYNIQCNLQTLDSQCVPQHSTDHLDLVIESVLQYRNNGLAVAGSCWA